MRGKKAKTLRKVIKRQIDKMSINSERDLMETRYEKVEKFARQYSILNKQGKPENIVLIHTYPIKLDFCFRRAYQSLKDTLKSQNKIKSVKVR